MKTRNTTTRFMNGNIDVDGEILDILIAEFGMAAVMERQRASIAKARQPI